jgi:GH15 family glucan-1,4-alpha-glucosidase
MPDRSYPPIADYAIIGDCRSGALVSKSGSIDWCCWPRFDSPAVFARILDWNRGGHFSVTPTVPFRSTRRYIPHTNVLVTSFETDSGRAELTDFMPVMTAEEKRRQLLPFREILRQVRGIEGVVPMRMEFQPRPDFGAVEVRLERRGSSLIGCRTPRELLLLASEPATLRDGGADCEFAVRAGQIRWLSLAFADEAPAVHPAPDATGPAKLAQSIDYWTRWAAGLEYRGPQRDAVERSALLLKLLLYAPSGAIVAAPTTSLPEWIGGPRNWDYRYCWLRDASFTARALYQLGFRNEGEAYCGWLMHATELTQPGLRILYDVYGRTRLEERTLDHLEGYRGSSPVRVGNAAFHQSQLDVYGELLNAIEHHFEQEARLDRDTRKLVRQIADLVAERWSEPDHGIWEMRSGTFQHVHGKVMAWEALDCVIRLADEGMLNGNGERWKAARAAIRQRVLTEGFHPGLGTFVHTLGGDRLDASLLTMPMSGFIAAHDPRMLATIRAIQSRLGVDGLVYRYRDISDGLPGDEGAFLACSFWLANALALAGEVTEAEALFATLMSRSNDVGLYSEEIDPRSGELLGNFPQALTHIALINAGLAMEQEEGGKQSFPKPQATS